MKVPFSAWDAVAWTGGELARGDALAPLAGASIDTRTVEAGELFVAVVGPNHDAHRFLPEAIAAGAAGLLVERGRSLPAETGKLPVIAVDNTTRALGDLACGHRMGFYGPLVAITGSNGKTSTKEMCAAILGVHAPCLKNRGNLNNQFGLPLTLLQRSPQHRSVVLELGMNHRGEIAVLAAIAQPSVAVVTNVGTAHIEFLGSQEEIAREKGDLFAALDAEGVAVVNADDPLVRAQAGRSRARRLTFGRGEDADVRAERVRSGPAGVCFDLVTPGGRSEARVAGLGDVAVQNALAAAAGAYAAGANVEDIARGLERYRPVAGRLERRDLPRDIVLIDDTYNANPQSMEVALRSLAELEGSGPRIAVLGDMGELGSATEQAHREAGRLVAELSIDFLVTVGAHADGVAAGATAAGMDPDRVTVGKDHAEASARTKALLADGSRVLVKGSRSMRMEQIVETLAAEESR